MDKAIQLALKNAQITRDEIDYLRKQLIIGGSTLESVLSAEAQLYDADSKEIGFIAERRKAEVTILATTGRLSKIIGADGWFEIYDRQYSEIYIHLLGLTAVCLQFILETLILSV